jgi:hypothetical protein
MKTYENYPVWIIMISNIVSLSIYGLGFFIMIRPGIIFSVLFLIYVFILEYRLIRYHCVNCFYYDKTCGFGKGRLSSLFFKKGDVSKSCIQEMSWKDMIPDLLISLIPFVVGIYFLITDFNIILLSSIILLLFLTTSGNGFIRSKLTCRYCKQKEIGCPADKLFNKK